MLDNIDVRNDKDWSSFEEVDSFNNNLVKGFICHTSNDMYGALYIERVNDKKVPQLILCTPKIRYPFDANGNWHFPKARAIQRYEKLDGTNIFQFRYLDDRGQDCTSYKTRLVPFLKDSKFGPFKQMWEEILDRCSYIKRIPIASGLNFSYELWGARNPHLVKYEVPLAASILFARKGRKIIPPERIIDELPVTPDYDLVKYAPFINYVDRDYVWNYEQAQEEAGATLKETEDGYLGTEGEVWYLLDETNTWNLFKCKPHLIEQIHWSAGGIGKNIIIATCENSFENWDEPTVENVIQLLLEEFNQQEVDKVYYNIETNLRKCYENHYFRQNVLEEYNNLGINILEDKVSVMRALSPKFNKKEMTKVYSTIMSYVVK